jgi:hypothetical protein
MHRRKLHTRKRLAQINRNIDREHRRIDRLGYRPTIAFGIARVVVKILF